MNNDGSADNSASFESSSSVVSSPAPAQSPEMIPKEQANSVLHGRLKDQERKLQADYESKIKEERTRWENENLKRQSQTGQASDDAGLDQKVDAILQNRLQAVEQKRAEDDFLRQLEQADTQLNKKFLEAKEEYPDFDQVVSKEVLSDQRVRILSLMTNEYDNSAAMMYELVNNGQKLGALLSSPAEVIKRDLARLSQSLKVNKEPNKNQVRSPLNQLSSSNVPTKPNNGDLSVEDFRNRHRGRW